MFKLSGEEKSVFKKIVTVVLAITVSWIAFYEMVSFFSISTNGKIIIILPLVLISIFSAYWEATKIAKPIMTLSEIMKKSTETNQMLVCEETTDDEIGQIIDYYNIMAKSMAIKNTEMSELNSRLSSSKEILRSQYEQLLDNQKRISESERRYKSLFELTSEGLFDMDANYNMTYFSIDWYENIGVDTTNPDLKEWTRFVVDEDKYMFEEKVDNQISHNKEDFISEYRIKDKFGGLHWIQAMAKATFDNNGEFVSMSGVHRDVTSSKEHEEEILKMAYYDRLTNLPNRLKFEKMVNEAIEKMAYFGVLYIDVDNFKNINDTYSHQFGDEVIIAMSKRLEKIINSEDSVSRLSGDEFGIISQNYTTKDEIEEYTKYILDQLSVPYTIGKIKVAFTASIGISIYPKDGKSFKDILVNLDIALYEAKDSTKNSYRFFREKMLIKSLEQANLESHLVKSLELDEIYVTYQPVMNLATKEVKGFEALLRWKDTEYGQVFPDVFIPIAENTGYIHQLGDYVLEQAIIFAKKLYEQYDRFFTINVNVSAVQLRKRAFVDRVQELLVKYQFPAEYLNLEITESVALDMDKKVIGRLAEIRKKGIDISLDDFGTGYASLNNLINLSVTHIKIDKSLVQQATTLKEVHTLIRGVVEFAHALELKVVAEGVETQNMESIISNMQIDYTQGYYYAKPLLEEDVFIFIEENK